MIGFVCGIIFTLVCIYMVYRPKTRQPYNFDREPYDPGP